MNKDPGMISNYLVNNPIASTNSGAGGLNLDSQTAAFLDGMKAQQQVGIDQRAENRNIEIERQAHAQANSQARAAGELMGLSQEEAAHLLRSKAQMIVEILRNPNVKFGRSR